MSTITSDFFPTRLKPGELNDLAEIMATPCVSILMPTHRSGPDTRQNAIRFKNLLGEAKEQLEKGGHDCLILDLIVPLSTSSNFWQHQGEGLALFLTLDQWRAIMLDREVQESVRVDDSLYLLPLVPQRDAVDSYFVLSLTWDEAKLFRSTGEALEVVETETLPAKFDDLVLPRDPEESLQNTSHRSVGNTASSSTTMFHGQGEGEDKIRADREHYLSLVGDQVAGAAYNTGLPLVIVATTEVAGHFEAVTRLTIDAKVVGSSSQWTDEELRVRVQDCVADQLQANTDRFFERFAAAVSQDKGSNNVAKVLTAAKHGRVESVLVCESEPDAVQLNAIAIETLRHGGDVFRGDVKQMPVDSIVAAIFRY